MFAQPNFRGVAAAVLNTPTCAVQRHEEREQWEAVPRRQRLYGSAASTWQYPATMSDKYVSIQSPQHHVECEEKQGIPMKAPGTGLKATHVLKVPAYTH